MTSKIYLASQSPRRLELLGQIGISVELLLPDASENAEDLEAQLAGESARHYVMRVTALKAGAAVVRHRRRKLGPGIIITADTTVAIGRTILGKPADDQEAKHMLRMLRGKTHRVLTALAMTKGARMDMALSESRVTFREITDAEIRAYVATGEPRGKAGAYAIQGKAAAFVASIAGSHSGIVGLPLFETMALLTRLGANPMRV
jgi:septum formation protein